MNHHPLCPEKTPRETSLATESNVKHPTSIYYIWFVFQTVQHPSGPSLVGLAGRAPQKKVGSLGGGSRQWRVWGVCGGSGLVGGSFQKAPGGLEGGSPRRQISGANAKRVEIERTRTNPAQISLTNHTICFSHVVDDRWAPFVFCPPHGHSAKNTCPPHGHNKKHTAALRALAKNTRPPHGHKPKHSPR